MFRGQVEPCAIFLAAVVVVVVVVGVGPCLATPPLSHPITQQELIMSVLINQMAILEGMNEPTSSASHSEELNQLREDMEKKFQILNKTVVEEMNGMNDKIEMINNTVVGERRDMNDMIEIMNETVVDGMKDMNDKIDGMNDTVVEGRNSMNDKIEIMNETVMEGRNDINEMSDKIGVVSGTLQTGITVLSETMNNEIESMNERGEDRTRQINAVNNKIDEAQGNVQRWMAEVNEKLGDIQNTVTDHHQRPDPAGLFVTHNDSLTSVCDGHKVLYGSFGTLKLASSITNYTNNVECSWTVTLPEGSRPVFQFRYFDVEFCNPCSKCDYIKISDPNHPRRHIFCGDIIPQGSYLTIMNNKFEVRFHSNGSKTGKGFYLWYRAVEMNH